MKLDLDYNNRQIIPRLLPYKNKSIFLTDKKIEDFEPEESDIQQYMKLKIDWDQNKSMSFAIQLVATAETLNLVDDDYYLEALSFIKYHNNLITDNQLLKYYLDPINNNDDDNCYSINLNCRELIREIKGKLLLYINDPVLWTDLAYYYVISRNKIKAERCISIALALNNYNPHIIRSAVRYFVYCQEPEKALYVLRKSPNLIINPTLLSAEISVAEAFHLKTVNVKKGIALLRENRHSHNLLAELNASIATIELNYGNIKKGKKLVNNALIDPNENTLAQIQYLAQKNNFVFFPQKYEVPCRYEADSLNYFYKNSYREVIVETRKWFDFHPFSSRPAILNSFVNATIFNNHEEAISIIDESLKLSSGNSLLLNNKAFSLAKIGKIDQAKECIKEIRTSKTNDFDNIDNNTLKATLGLIEYRSKNPEEGRKLYQEAVDFFEKNGYYDLQARALYFWAEEEENFNVVESKKILSKASDIALKYNVQETKALLEKKEQLKE